MRSRQKCSRPIGTNLQKKQANATLVTLACAVNAAFGRFGVRCAVSRLLSFAAVRRPRPGRLFSELGLQATQQLLEVAH